MSEQEEVIKRFGGESATEILREGNSYWGKVTSLLDWCEENYAVTDYVAEFWNSTTSILMLLLGLYGAYVTYGYSTKFRNHWKEKFLVISGCFFCLAIVGFGSAMFHGTLLYKYQLLDELPMLLGNGFFIYTTSHKDYRRSGVRNVFIFMLFSYVSLATAIYVTIRWAEFFQICYGLGVVVLLYRSVRLINEYKSHKVAVRLLYFGIGNFLFAFLIWNIENVYCVQLRKFRNELPLEIMKPFFQLHSLWHILSGFGTYCFINFAGYTKILAYDGGYPEIKYYFNIIPILTIDKMLPKYA